MLRTACATHAHWNPDCDNCAEITRLTRALEEARGEFGCHNYRGTAITCPEYEQIARRRSQTAESEVAHLAAVVASIKTALAPAAIWEVNGVERLLHAIDGDGLSREDLARIVTNLLRALTSDGAPLLAVVEAAMVWQDAPRDNFGRIRDEAIARRLLDALNDYRYPR